MAHWLLGAERICRSPSFFSLNLPRAAAPRPRPVNCYHSLKGLFRLVLRIIQKDSLCLSTFAHTMSPDSPSGTLILVICAQHGCFCWGHGVLLTLFPSALDCASPQESVLAIGRALPKFHHFPSRAFILAYIHQKNITDSKVREAGSLSMSSHHGVQVFLVWGSPLRAGVTAPLHLRELWLGLGWAQEG